MKPPKSDGRYWVFSQKERWTIATWKDGRWHTQEPLSPRVVWRGPLGWGSKSRWRRGGRRTQQWFEVTVRGLLDGQPVEGTYEAFCESLSDAVIEVADRARCEVERGQRLEIVDITGKAVGEAE